MILAKLSLKNASNLINFLISFIFFFCDSIFQVFVYYDNEKKHSKKHKIPLTAVYMKGCPANTCSIQMPEIIVPPVPATDIVSSKIIHITYELKVRITTKTMVISRPTSQQIIITIIKSSALKITVWFFIHD